jgi:hypothetical protein
MRRTGVPLRVLSLLLAGLAALAAPRLGSASPLIDDSSQSDSLAGDAQPLAPFRLPPPFLPAKTSPGDGIALFKSFLADRSPLADEPAQATPALSDPKPASLRTGATPSQEMPADVADAVKALKRKGIAPTPPAEVLTVTPIKNDIDAATRAAVANAVKILSDPANRAAPAQIVPAAAALLPPLTVAPNPDASLVRDEKLAAVADSIAALKLSLKKRKVAEMPPLVVLAPPLAPPQSPSISFAEEQAAPPAVVKASAQVPLPPELPATLPPITPVMEPPPPALVVTHTTDSCTTCGRIIYARPIQRLREVRDSIGGCTTCGGWRCSPGHPPCEPCEAHDGPLGRLFCDFYECLCCPDPCYEPKWRQVPNAALFVDGARPVTQMEVRWNSGKGGIFPDRSEYIWARADGQGRGPRPPAGARGEFQFDYDDLVLITETAKDKISAIVAMPYRAVSPDTYAHGAGFGDMAIGTKTLLLDCELVQVSMQMLTYMPIGNSLKGVGNGHVSLEPSLLFALKLACETYIQGQFSEWIPLGGDPNYMGSIFHTHFSLNHVIHRCGPDIPLVGTFEVNTYSFQDGAYTDPIRGNFQKSSDTTYVSLGPGLRLFFCDKLDIGFGAAIAVTGDHFAREFYRTSVRFRF